MQLLSHALENATYSMLSQRSAARLTVLLQLVTMRLGCYPCQMQLRTCIAQTNNITNLLLKVAVNVLAKSGHRTYARYFLVN